MTLALTAGQRHETQAFHELMEHGAIKRMHRGRPRLRPDRLIGDKAYSSGEIRAYLQKHGVRCTIPRRSDERRRGSFDRQTYRVRNTVERLVNLYKQFRGLATRYEKRADSYRALWIIAAIFLWLK